MVLQLLRCLSGRYTFHISGYLYYNFSKDVKITRVTSLSVSRNRSTRSIHIKLFERISLTYLYNFLVQAYHINKIYVLSLNTRFTLTAKVIIGMRIPL